MVGLKNMESSRLSCAFCKGMKPSITNCDKTTKPVCSECATIIPVPPSVDESMIRIVAKRVAPNKHLSKLTELAIKRGEING